MKNTESRKYWVLGLPKHKSNSELSLGTLTRKELEELRAEMRKDGAWMKKELLARLAD